MGDKFLKVYQLLAFLMTLNLIVMLTTVTLNLFSIANIDPIYAMIALLSVPVLVVIALGFAVVDLITS